MSKIQKVNYIVVHHSASSTNLKMEDLKRIHLEKGWSDIGYHKVIEWNGQVKQGREESVIGSQAFGLNSESLGICLIGNFENIEPSDSQIHSLIQTLAILCKKYKLTKDKILGHRDVSAIKKDTSLATACPGKNLYLLLPFIREKVGAYL